MNNITTHDLYHYGFKPDGTPKYLYHYTTFDSFIQIVKNGTLKLCALTGMNDPYEFLSRNNGIIREGDPTNEELASKLAKNIVAHKERTNCVRLASLAADSNDGIMLHKGWNLLNMWTLYGRNHTGVCLVFDYDSLKTEVDAYCSEVHINGMLKPITYVTNFDAIEDMFWNPVSFIDNEHIYHLFTKPDCYEKEQEYRLLVINKQLVDSSTPVFIPINTAIRGVITGYKFPHKTYDNELNEVISNLNNIGYNISQFELNPYQGFDTHSPLYSKAESHVLFKRYGLE